MVMLAQVEGAPLNNNNAMTVTDIVCVPVDLAASNQDMYYLSSGLILIGIERNPGAQRKLLLTGKSS